MKAIHVLLMTIFVPFFSIAQPKNIPFDGYGINLLSLRSGHLQGNCCSNVYELEIYLLGNNSTRTDVTFIKRVPIGTFTESFDLQEINVFVEVSGKEIWSALGKNKSQNLDSFNSHSFYFKLVEKSFSFTEPNYESVAEGEVSITHFHNGNNFNNFSVSTGVGSHAESPLLRGAVVKGSAGGFVFTGSHN